MSGAAPGLRAIMLTLVVVLSISLSGSAARAQEEAGPAAGGGSGAEADAEALAKQLANPVAALISVPLQLNYDRGIGPDDGGTRWTLNVQPVVPITLNEDWNLISRTIVPLVAQDEIVPGVGSQTGLSDIVQSVFFSPAAPTASGWIWGVGPVFLLPTGTDDLLTADRFGLGPAAVALKQAGGWTYGALVNHLWSVAGNEDRGDVNATFLQPFFSYTTPTAFTYTLQAEATRDWEGESWSIPVGAIASKVTRVGGQLVSVSLGARYYVDSAPGGPEGFGARAVVTLLFPR